MRRPVQNPSAFIYDLLHAYDEDIRDMTDAQKTEYAALVYKDETRKAKSLVLSDRVIDLLVAYAKNSNSYEEDLAQISFELCDELVLSFIDSYQESLDEVVSDTVIDWRNHEELNSNGGWWQGYEEEADYEDWIETHY